MSVADDEYLEAMRDRRPARERARRHGGPRQGRLARRAAALAAARGARAAARCASGSRSRRPRRAGSRRSGCARGSATTVLRLGYLKVFMDGTLGSQTALDARRQRASRSRAREELAEIVRRGAARRLPGRRPRDRRPREPRRARRVRGDARRLAAARPPPADRALRSCWRPRTSPASRSSASPLGAVHATRRPTATSPTASGPARPTARTPSARCSTPGAVVANGSDAPIEELDPLAGIRAGVLRTIDDRAAWHPEQAVTVDAGARARPASRPPGSRATSGAAASCSRATSPTSSCSTATRWDDLDAQVVATMVGGRWVHNPPPWD